jgi:DNA primase
VARPSSPDRPSVTVDDVRERADLVEIISTYITLQPAGKRFKGVCPFHPDQAPSMTVDPEKQLWHCFGCKAGGNVFHFLMKIENLTFPEAAQKLAQRVGLQLTEAERDPVRASENDRLAQVNREAARFFRDRLRGPAGAGVRAYLEQRGVVAESVRKFGLGYAPADWEALTTHLRGKGFTPVEIEKAGLAIRRNAGGAGAGSTGSTGSASRAGRTGHYDRFRHRLMIPIFDLTERVIAFGGRSLPGGDHDGQDAKYLNSPETPLFHKGRTLYGLHLARRAIGEKGRVVIVEGYFDLIAAHEYGFEETVATLGTALTEDHLRTLRRYTKRVITAFDADSAGLEATLRSRRLYGAAEMEMRVALLPPKRDPDAFLREQGAEPFAAALENAVGIIDCQLAAMRARYGPPEASLSEDDRLRLMREVVPVLAELSALEQAHHARKLAEEWSHPHLERAALAERAIHEELRRVSRAPEKPREGRAAPAPAAAGARESACHRAERQLLALMLRDAQAVEEAAAALTGDDFSDPQHRAVFEVSCHARTEERTASPEEIIVALGDAAADLVAQLAMMPTPERPRDFAADCIERLRRERLSARFYALDRRLRNGENLTAEELAEMATLKRSASDIVGRRSGSSG